MEEKTNSLSSVISGVFHLFVVLFYKKKKLLLNAHYNVHICQKIL